MTQLRLKGGTLQDWRQAHAQIPAEQKQADKLEAGLRSRTHRRCVTCKQIKPLRTFLHVEANLTGGLVRTKFFRRCTRCRTEAKQRRRPTG